MMPFLDVKQVPGYTYSAMSRAEGVGLTTVQKEKKRGIWTLTGLLHRGVGEGP